jgi:hypothetical protein
VKAAFNVAAKCNGEIMKYGSPEETHAVIMSMWYRKVMSAKMSMASSNEMSSYRKRRRNENEMARNIVSK